jgi:HEAT repeat protein
MSSNPEIRILAANKLAEDGAHDAIPAIETALQVEKSVNAEANIAQALWVLHDPKGVERLLTMCADPGLRTGDLLITLVILQNTQTSVSTCANTLLDAISRERDMGLLAMSLARLPFVSRDAPPDIRARILEVLSAFLFDTAQPFIVRQSSSQALAQIGSLDARDAIQKAITTEKNQGSRESFERDLKVIENKS